MSKLAFYVDINACSGCKACQVACKDKNDLWPGISWRRVYEVEVGEWKSSNGVVTEKPTAYYLSISCNHCEEPECLKACPSKAIFKTLDGLVLVDPDLCIGCMYCEWTCPYGALSFDFNTGVMSKCDGCEDLLYLGENPACVDACSMRVLHFGDFRQFANEHGEITSVYPLPDYSMTKPGLILTPHNTAKRAGPSNAEVNNTENYRQ
jgi:anaerobic dimethyl sulfoxide reductase subunit B